MVQGLRQRGVDVVTTPESGMLGASDEEHLRRASAEGRVMVTQDDDFLRCTPLVWSTPESSTLSRTTPLGKSSAV